GIRTPVAAVKGRCPRPLDERDILKAKLLVLVLVKSGGQIKPLLSSLCVFPKNLSKQDEI
ncbi:MAG: hypothetical protein O2813_06880, partial [Proteobacteria bacterium]|nr:hypothetical protein [Pseudomonadota bacterium]